MKKNERRIYTRERAYELAYAGKGIHFRSIEQLLNKEGLTEARRILDNPDIRSELNDICDIANSPFEIENRHLFIDWIKTSLTSNIQKIKKSYPNVIVSFINNGFEISLNNNKIKIFKKFNSRKLYGHCYFEMIDSKIYKSQNCYESEQDFNNVELSEFINIVKKLL